MFNNKVPYQTALSESKINYFSRKSIRIYQFNVYPNIDSKAISSFEIDGFVIANSIIVSLGVDNNKWFDNFQLFLDSSYQRGYIGKNVCKSLKASKSYNLPNAKCFTSFNMEVSLLVPVSYCRFCTQYSTPLYSRLAEKRASAITGI